MGDFGVSYIFMLIIFIAIWIAYRIIILKKCKVNVLREVVINIFFMYFLVVIYYTLFKQGQLEMAFGSQRYINMVPLKETINMFLDEYSEVSFGLYNVLGNVLLFMPLGFFIPLLFKKGNDVKKVLLYGFIGSLLIEIIQYFTIRNITDIDDVILNTLGALLGLMCYRIIRGIIVKGNRIKILEKVEDKETKKLLGLAIKPLGAMLTFTLVFLFINAYNSTYSGKLPDDDLAVEVSVNHGGGNFIMSKDFKNYKFILMKNGEYFELIKLKMVLNGRYINSYTGRRYLDKNKSGYGIEILDDHNNEDIGIVVYGKNNEASSISITLNGEEYIEELEPNDYFIVVYPSYCKISEVEDIYGIYKENYNEDYDKNLKIKFFDNDGDENRGIKLNE